MQVNRLRWRAGKLIGGETSAGEEAEVSYEVRAGVSWQSGDSAAFMVELQPMEIRTFLLTAEARSAQRGQALWGAAAAA